MPGTLERLGGVFSVAQLEIAPSTGTPHYQGYVEWATRKRLSEIKNLLPRAHWEAARGSRADNIKYCSKADTRAEGPWSVGEIPDGEQGERTDLLEVKSAIDGGASMLDIAETHFTAFVKYHKGFTIYKRLKADSRQWKTEGIVLEGDTGLGKSHLARQLVGVDKRNVFWLTNDAWWCGYDGQPWIVVEEFTGNLNIRTMLMLLDEYPLSVNAKGDTINFLGKIVFITTNIAMEDWYPTASKTQTEAISRRVNVRLHFSSEKDNSWATTMKDKHREREYIN